MRALEANNLQLKEELKKRSETMSCAWCSESVPNCIGDGIEHLNKCKNHPMRKLEAMLKKVKDHFTRDIVLIGIKGVFNDSEKELWDSL
jgi:hypothetical protein